MSQSSGPLAGARVRAPFFRMPNPGLSTVTPIVNVGFRSTNIWVVGAGTTRLLVDLGWVGMMGALQHELRRKDIPLDAIRAGFATHYHIDHAGCAEDLKRHGMALWVFEEQVPSVDGLSRWVKRGEPFTPIRSEGNVLLRCVDSRRALSDLGIAGEVIPTPGHSPCSVSLVLNSGACFTGDLTPEAMVGSEDRTVVRASWDRLRALGARTVYPGHAAPYPMPPA